MKYRKYDKTIDYTNKWCLYRKYDHEEYSSIYVIAIEDNIVKFVDEDNPTKIHYEDISKYEYYDSFFVNPIQGLTPEIVHKTVEEIDYTNPYVIRNIKGIVMNPCDNGCEHSWEYYDLLSYPPIHCRRCTKCGKTQHKPDTSAVDSEFIDGNGY